MPRFQIPAAKYLNVLSDPEPVVCSHVGRVQQRTVLQDGVDYPPFCLTQPERGNSFSSVPVGEITNSEC